MYENIIAVHMDILDLQIEAKIESVLNKWYRQVNFTEIDKKAIVELCSQDKKNENGEIRMSLIDQIGHCTYDVPVETKLIQLG
jgi:3-dehydroquinate synthase